MGIDITGGGGGIRTHGPLAGTTVFKTASIGHSDTPPEFKFYPKTMLQGKAGRCLPDLRSNGRLSPGGISPAVAYFNVVHIGEGIQEHFQ
jgi:hypothetical protein